MNPFFDWIFRTQVDPVTGQRTIEFLPPPIYGFLLVACLYATCLWVAADEKRRARSPCLAQLFVLIMWWPVSILCWLWLRPPIVFPTPENEKLRIRDYLFLAGLLGLGIGTIYLAMKLTHK